MLKLVSVFIITFLSFTQYLDQDYYFQPEFSTIIDSKKGFSILYQCSRRITNEKDISGFWDINDSEIKQLENNFKKIIKLESKKALKISDLKEYGYQYIGVEINNKKYIYINAFIITSKEKLDTFYGNWEINPIVVCDGGKSFWGSLFDLQNSTFSQLLFNGIG